MVLATRNTWMQTPTKKMLSTVKPDLSTKPSDSKQGRDSIPKVF